MEMMPPPRGVGLAASLLVSHATALALPAGGVSSFPLHVPFISHTVLSHSAPRCCGDRGGGGLPQVDFFEFERAWRAIEAALPSAARHHDGAPEPLKHPLQCCKVLYRG
jgi:hypothetical protein